MSFTLATVGLAAWEGGWWLRRRQRRQDVYWKAWRRSRELKKPLVVVGAPDGGVTGGYGCGDYVFDLKKSACTNSYVVDVSRPLPGWRDGCCVVFVSCVLEYVRDIDGALRELRRISGGELFVVGVEPWTLAGWLYPGARRRLGPHLR